MDKLGTKKLTMDKISSQAEAEHFLRGLGLTVREEVVRRVVDVARGKVKTSWRSLWKRNKPNSPEPLCGKGTVKKIRKLLEDGRLMPYLDYLDGGGTAQPANDQALPSGLRATHGSQEPEAAPRVSEAAGPHRATDPEFGPHGRGLFYFGQGLRDRLSLPSPVNVVKDMPTLPPLWEGESASEFRGSQGGEEASVAREWGYSPVDATQLPSFAAFKKHLAGNPCWRELDALMEVYPRYCKSCQEAYQGLMVQYTGCSVAAGDEDARLMATAVLREVWHRVERGASLISPQVLAAKDDIVVALPWEVRMGAWAIRRRSEGEAKEVESAFLKLASTAVEEGKLQEALRLYQLLAEKREAFRRFVAPDDRLRKLILGGVWDNWGLPRRPA